MNPHRLETGCERDGVLGPLITGHTSYFMPGSTSARNLQGVIEGSKVYPYVLDQGEPAPGSPAGVTVRSPLLDDPEEYAYGRMPSVPVDSLER